MWQDFVFSAGSLIFIIALIPSIISKDSKPALSSSLLTGSVLLVFALTYTTLGLWFSFTTTLGTAVCWFILACHKYHQPDPKVVRTVF